MPEIIDQPKPVVENVPPLAPVEGKGTNLMPLLGSLIVVAVAGLFIYFFLLTKNAQAPAGDFTVPTPTPAGLTQPSVTPSDESSPSAQFPALIPGSNPDDIIKDINNTDLGSSDADFTDLTKDAVGL